MQSKKFELKYLMEVAFAKTFIFEVARQYWNIIKQKNSVNWCLRHCKENSIKLSKAQLLEAKFFSQSLVSFDTLQAGYIIADKYMTLLPQCFRQKYGVFFTPLAVVEKMLDDAEKAGINFHKAKIVDPAAGGAAFLAPLCRRMIRKDLRNPQKIMSDLLCRIKGFEIDPFSAWLSQFLIDCELSTSAPTYLRPKSSVECLDALFIQPKYFGLYDLVIGNPPYGKTIANKELKDRYSEVLYGAPNFYQLFYSLSLSLAKKDGLIQLITPTSFIGGDYFKKLRETLEKYSCPIRFDFFESRTHIFDGVLQELVISIFKKGKPLEPAPIYQVKKDNVKKLFIEKVGKCSFPKKALWVFPKDKNEAALSLLYNKNYETLETLGFKIKTGYVVPHRSADLIGNRSKGELSFPIIWSGAIHDYCFDSERAFNRGKPRWYYQPPGKCAGLIKESVLLIKRISSKEQSRRIHSAVVPSSYLKRMGGFFVENHLNILYSNYEYNLDLDTINKLLSTELIDLLFRGISGSVTVSAAELKRLPMPSKDAFLQLEEEVKRASNKLDVENAAWRAYGII